MKKITLLFLLVFSTINTYSKGDSLKYPFWLNLSLGAFPEYFGAGLSYNRTFEEYSYQVSINSNGKLKDFSLLGGKSSNLLTLSSGLGRTNWDPSLMFSAYVGPSVSYGEAKRNHVFYYFWAAGLSLNAQIYFMPLYKLFPGLGIGFEFYYNYNFMQTKAADFRHVYLLRIGGTITNLHDKVVPK